MVAGPGVVPMIPPGPPRGQGLLRIVCPDQLTANEAANDKARVDAEDRSRNQGLVADNLVSFIDGEFSRFQRHRNSAAGWSDRMVAAMRVFNGEYDPGQLAAIRQFGGSEVYARLIATKCRGASSLLGTSISTSSVRGASRRRRTRRCPTTSWTASRSSCRSRSPTWSGSASRPTPMPSATA